MGKRNSVDLRVLVVLGILCAVAAWWVFGQTSDAPLADAPQTSAPEPVAEEAVERRHIPRPKRKVTRSAPVPASDEAEATVVEASKPQTDTGLFETPEPTVRLASDDPGFTAAIDSTVREQFPAIMGCVRDWVNAGTVIDGRVRMGFKLDSDGLQDVWIARRDEVPLGVTSCLSGAIWQANWPGTTNGEEIIQYPFHLTSDDEEE